MTNKFNANYRVYQGVLQQDMQAVRDFWDQCDTHTFRNEILIGAMVRASEDIFLFVADRCSNENISRNICCVLDQLHRFQYLSSRVDFTYNHSNALSWAAQKGDFHMVNRLLPMSAPQDPHCQALYNALFEDHRDIVDLLFPVCNIEATMDQLINSEYDCEREIEWLQEKINVAQNNTLTQEVQNNGITRVKKL